MRKPTNSLAARLGNPIPRTLSSDEAQTAVDAINHRLRVYEAALKAYETDINPMDTEVIGVLNEDGASAERIATSIVHLRKARTFLCNL